MENKPAFFQIEEDWFGCIAGLIILILIGVIPTLFN